MFFGFFKRKKKETEVKFDNVKEWLVESEQIKDILAKFNNEVSTCFSQISKSFDEIEPLLKKLEEVDLKERRFNVRAKNIVLQNKTAYIEHVRHFLDKLEVIKSNDVKDVEKFVFVTSEQLNSFLKHSFKAFNVTSELIGKELKGVVDCIKTISNNVEGLKLIDKEKVKAIELIKDNLGVVAEKERFIDNLKSEIKNKQKEEQGIDKKLSSIEKKNEEIKVSSEWEKKQELIKYTALLNKKLEANSAAVSGLFLSIEKALKKWAWKENKVLENPLILLKDSDLLNKVKEDIIQDKLGFDEKRKDLFLKNLSMITPEKIVSFTEEEKKIKEAIQKNEQELSDCSVELIDNAQLITQKNDFILEIVKVEKKQNRLEQDILNKKSEIEDVIKTVILSE